MLKPGPAQPERTTEKAIAALAAIRVTIFFINAPFCVGGAMVAPVINVIPNELNL